MLNQRMLSVAALGTVLTTLLPAQTAAQPNANRFVPENSSIVLRIASPAKWRAQFGKTQAAKLMAADSMAPIVQSIAQRIDMGIEQLRDSGMFDADLAESLLNDWQGDITLSAQVDWDNLMEALDYGEAPPMSFVVALSPDGKFDLAAVAKEFGRMVEDSAPNGGDLRDLAVGDLTLRRSDNGGDEPDMALPTMIDGHLVMIGGTQLEKDAAKLIGSEARSGQKIDDAPFFLSADLGKLMKAAMDADNGGGPVDTGEMLDMMGLSALQGMTLSLKPVGKSVAGEMHLGMSSENRGMLNMIVNSNQQPKLLTSVPSESDSFSVSSIDIGALYRTLEDIWTSMEEFTPMSFDDAMGMFADATKVRLKQDLFDHLGKEMLVVQDFEGMEIDPDELEDNPLAAMGGTVYGIALTDGQAFGASLDKALRSRGMHVGRKTEEYGKAKINRMKIAGMFPIEYVVENDVLLIGVGGDDGSRRALRSVLDARAAEERQLPALVAMVNSEFEAGWNGIGTMPIATTLEMAVKMMESSGEFGSEMGMISQVVGGMAQDMKRLGIDKMVSASYCNDNEMVVRFRW